MIFIFILFLNFVLILRLYFLQIVCYNDYCTRSNENRIKLIPLCSSRGNIYDCRGIPIALNKVVYQLELVSINYIDSLNSMFNELRSIVDLNDEDILNFHKSSNNRIYKSFYSFPVKINLTESQCARFAVNRFKFPGLEIRAYQRRYYPYKSILTHLVGYVAKISMDDVCKLRKDGQLGNYDVNRDSIGKLGVEKYYEYVLHGRVGYEEVEVNNKGCIIRKLYVHPPQDGNDLYLTIDLKLQQYIKKLLLNDRAAVVVVDPRDGGIKAMVSNPSYDPNLFVRGISNYEYDKLLNDDDYPLINRVTQGIYPPASTIKPYISVSALTCGIINKDYSLFDPGWWQLPGSNKKYRDWKKSGHGNLNIIKALEESSDTFFYQISYDMGIDKLSEWMMKFGYGKSTGVDLFEEDMGIMPTRSWKMKRFKKPWYRGDTISVGIGQGYWTATPLQMSKSLMILINNGRVFTPHLLSFIHNNDGSIILYTSNVCDIDIGSKNSEFWNLVKSGMYGVANNPNGTANKIFINSPYKIAAKSGTAQVYRLKSNEVYNAYKINKKLRDHKLMVAFAPYENPVVGIVVILENSEGKKVGEISRKILDYYLISN